MSAVKVKVKVKVVKSKSKVKVIKSKATDPGKILSTLEEIAVKTTACCLSRLSFSERKACSESQLEPLIVQQVLRVVCCFAERTEHQPLKLTWFATHQGPLALLFTMLLVCCIACKLNTCLHLCFSGIAP